MTGTTIDAFVLGGWKERQRREGKNLGPLVSEVLAGSLVERYVSLGLVAEHLGRERR